MIKTIFFDFDDTLGNRELYAWNAYHDILKENTDLSGMEFEAVLQEVMIWDQKGDVNKNYIKEMPAKVFDIHLPYPDFNTYWNSLLYKYCVPMEDAADTLSYLEKKYRLGIISNGPSDAQRNKLKKSGLESFFDENMVFISGDFGIKKPDLRLFLKACELAGAKPEECVYVGDIFYRDVLGSWRAGMKPVWIINQERKCTVDIPVIHHISDLKKIL